MPISMSQVRIKALSQQEPSSNEEERRQKRKRKPGDGSINESWRPANLENPVDMSMDGVWAD